MRVSEAMASERFEAFIYEQLEPDAITHRGNGVLRDSKPLKPYTSDFLNRLEEITYEQHRLSELGDEPV